MLLACSPPRKAITCAGLKALRALDRREECGAGARIRNRTACESRTFTHKNGKVSQCQHDPVGRCEPSAERLMCNSPGLESLEQVELVRMVKTLERERDKLMRDIRQDDKLLEKLERVYGPFADDDLRVSSSD